MSYDYERLQYNTVVSGAMKILHLLEEVARTGGEGAGALVAEGLPILLRVLYPVAPHITQALWTELGIERQLGELFTAPWPEADPAALQRDSIDLVVQVNGKLRGSIRVPAGASHAEIEQAALADPAVAKFVTGTPRKVIIVPGKLVNVVA